MDIENTNSVCAEIMITQTMAQHFCNVANKHCLAILSDCNAYRIKYTLVRNKVPDTWKLVHLRINTDCLHFLQGFEKLCYRNTKKFPPLLLTHYLLVLLNCLPLYIQLRIHDGGGSVPQ
jgi:hypothetical protein